MLVSIALVAHLFLIQEVRTVMFVQKVNIANKARKSPQIVPQEDTQMQQVIFFGFLWQMFFILFKAMDYIHFLKKKVIYGITLHNSSPMLEEKAYIISNIIHF